MDRNDLVKDNRNRVSKQMDMLKIQSWKRVTSLWERANSIEGRAGTKEEEIGTGARPSASPTKP